MNRSSSTKILDLKLGVLLETNLEVAGSVLSVSDRAIAE